MKKLLFLFLFLCLAALGTGVGLYIWASKDLPGFTRLTDYRPPLVTTVYARDGRILGYLYKEKRFLVDLKSLPPHLIKAFLAAEDDNFYKHEGIDFVAILRAFIKNLQIGEIKQGGSTITQQIIKNMVLSADKKYERKLKEAILAYRLERYLTKEEILTIYVNQIFFGSAAYGIEAAARTYFGAHVEDLTLAQSAMLAGLPQAPSQFSPYKNFKAAKWRQKYVLGRMLSLGWISKEEHDAAEVEPLALKQMPDPSWGTGAYYLEEVRRFLIDRFGEDYTYNGGLHVYTAMDFDHQEKAEAALRAGLSELAKRRGYGGAHGKLTPDKWAPFLKSQHINPETLNPGTRLKVLITKVTPTEVLAAFGNQEAKVNLKTIPRGKRAPQVGHVFWATVNLAPEAKKKKASDEKAPPSAPKEWMLSLELEPEVDGAMVSIEMPSGAVVACVGGYSFERSQFNRATQAFRQPGSAFKPVVYSAAMDNGLTPASVVSDGPFIYVDPWTKKVWRPTNYGGGFGGPMSLRAALAASRNMVTIRLAQIVGVDKVIARAKELGIPNELPAVLPVSLGAGEVTLMDLCKAYTAFAMNGAYVTPRFVTLVKSPWEDEILLEMPPESTQGVSPQNAYIINRMMREVVRSGTGIKANSLGRDICGKTGTTNDEKDAWFIGFSPYLLTGVYVGFDQTRTLGRGEQGGRTALPIWLSYRKGVEDKYEAVEFTKPEGIVMANVDGRSMPFVAGTEKQHRQFVDQATEGRAAGDSYDSGHGSGSGPVVSGDDLLKQMF